MDERFIRTEALLGGAAMERLQKSRVAVFGIGGVGGSAAQALVWSGVGTIDIIDNDVVSKSNINRQVTARTDTIGRYKTDVMYEELKALNPDVNINIRRIFFLPETELDFSVYDYILDAIDTVSGKIEIAARAEKCGVGVISSMGTGNKLHPEMLEIADIYATSVCPLARVMRRELKSRGVRALRVVYSKETPLKPCIELRGDSKKDVPGSAMFVPAAAGMIMAAEAVRALAKGDSKCFHI